jgi:hypothetical protein
MQINFLKNVTALPYPELPVDIPKCRKGFTIYKSDNSVKFIRMHPENPDSS